MQQFVNGHQVQLLQGTVELFPAMVAAMDAAQHDIRLETYIFDFTSTGADVGTALVRAALRGVRVRLMVDGAGTSQIPADWRERFDAAGVQWHIFNPMGRLGMLVPSHWRRLHRKLCVVDADTPRAMAFCGGINILDDYFDPNHGVLKAPRFDFSVRVSGPLVATVVEAMDRLWQRTQTVRSLRQRELGAAITTWVSSRAVLFGSASSPQNATHSVASPTMIYRAGLLLRDNFRNRKRIERAYLKAIGEAHHEIIIANAYFLPGGKLRHALLAAAQRGVKVKLLLQGRYEYFMQYHAARPVYSALLAAGVEIHEYASSFLHAKVAVVDAMEPQAWATVGSSNLDPLSLLLAREANIVVRGSEFAQTLHAKLEYAMAHDGKRIDPADYANRPLAQRARDMVAYGLMRAALWSTGNRY
jgi:cardiolipin synthase A/B